MSESGRIIEIGESCRGNTGQWGRVVVYEFDTPLGPMPMADWEQLPEPAEANTNETGGAMTETTSRSEHLAWCKQRALEYVDAGQPQHALASMASDLDKHPETRSWR